MKLFKKSRKNPFSEENLRSIKEEIMNSGSEKIEQIKQEMQETVDEQRREIIGDYKFQKQMYEDFHGGNIEDDEDFDDIHF
jgi:hypothetical protein